MRLATGLATAMVLFWAGAALATTFNTPVLDGVIGIDWMADEQFETNNVDGCDYTLWMTWDADLLWIGLDSDTCRRYLGDGAGDISFFVGIDVDQLFGSGLPQEGYGNVEFYGCYMPDYIFFYAGGAGWYEWGHWNGVSFDWLGWRSDNTYYAWSGGGVYDDELGILWSDLGYPQGISVMAWMTDEPCFNTCGGDTCRGVIAAWPPQNPTGQCPTFKWAYPFFMPYIPGPMPVAGFSPNSVTPQNGEATATQPTSWGTIKALYR